jgi:hypothetical protein
MLERASDAKSTESRERAIGSERTISQERAKYRESTNA